MTTLTTATINALSNEELKSHMTTMAAAIQGMHKNTWMYAIALNEIIEGEEYLDDYDSMTKFADSIGLSKATVSQYTGAVQFMNKHNYFPTATGAAFWDGITFSLGAAYLLSTLGDEYEAFTLWCDAQGISVPALAQSALKKQIKAFKARNEAAEESEESEESEATEATEETEAAEAAPETVKGILVRDADGNEYFVPADVLAQYRK